MLTLTTPFAQMSRPPVHDTPAIQSLDRGLAILEAVASSPAPVPLKQLTDLIGIDRSSVFRLANTLRQRRFLANPKGQQGLHPRPDGVAAVAPLRAHRARHVLPPLPAGAVGDARRDVALRRPRGGRGVLHRPPHPRRPDRVGGGADRRIRAAALHRARQGAARRLRSRPPCASCSGGRRCASTRARP